MVLITYQKVGDPLLALSFVKDKGTQQEPAVLGWFYVGAAAAGAGAGLVLSVATLPLEPLGRSQIWRAFCHQDSWALYCLVWKQNKKFQRLVTIYKISLEPHECFLHFRTLKCIFFFFTAYIKDRNGGGRELSYRKS